MRIAIIHGPNLNLLGRREPEVYGHLTLEQVDARLAGLARELDVELETFQSNGEGELLQFIHTSSQWVMGFVINAGAYTHTSIALLDALVGAGRPYVEVHLSNLHAREPFRRTSLLAPRATGLVMGFGVDSYLLGLRGLVYGLRGASVNDAVPSPLA